MILLLRETVSIGYMRPSRLKWSENDHFDVKFERTNYYYCWNESFFKLNIESSRLFTLREYRVYLHFLVYRTGFVIESYRTLNQTDEKQTDTTKKNISNLPRTFIIRMLFFFAFKTTFMSVILFFFIFLCISIGIRLFCASLRRLNVLAKQKNFNCTSNLYLYYSHHLQTCISHTHSNTIVRAESVVHRWA